MDDYTNDDDDVKEDEGDRDDDANEDDSNTDNSVYSDDVCAGFDKKRQKRASLNLNLERFRSRIGPKAVAAVCSDLIAKYPTQKLSLKYIFLTLNWLKLYVSENVLSGWWGFCGDNIREKVKEAKNRQESFNSRLKAFNVLSLRCRHGSSTKDKMDRHKACVEAICALCSMIWTMAIHFFRYT
eukprot:CCRYP_011346-RA/>CCRYP_011346-RA protein AED:0.37 eAED:0.26 QI:0/0/0/0.75/0/0/4/0/182